MAQVFHKIDEIRKQVAQWKKEGLKVGLVPTMGALHTGHASLIKKSVGMCDKTVVSVFVNPAQFGVNEDFSKYPRTLEADVELSAECGADIVFAPSSQEMYGDDYDKDNLTFVCPPYDLVNELCGKTRTGHFDGVALVVSKLFNIVQSDFAYFGEKDFQQLVIIKRTVKDLNFPVEIVGCPIVREESGLAVSSRNSYLTDEEKLRAACIYKALMAVKKGYEGGIKETDTLLEIGLEQMPKGVEVEYFDFLDYDKFQKTSIIDRKALVAVCVRVGMTRLIDNIIIG